MVTSCMLTPGSGTPLAVLLPALCGVLALLQHKSGTVPNISTAKPQGSAGLHHKNAVCFLLRCCMGHVLQEASWGVKMLAGAAALQRTRSPC